MIMSPADRFDTFAVGQHATSVHRVTITDVVLYAAVTGDLNPVHVDAPLAAASRFGGRIAHGMLSMGFVSALIARALAKLEVGEIGWDDASIEVIVQAADEELVRAELEDDAGSPVPWTVRD